jgi:aryl-alcohol dehydrogenase-like predicted oxidoreductase
VKNVENPFIDTAELYPVPPRAETVGRTEVIIGNWLEKNPGMRQKIFLASKVFLHFLYRGNSQGVLGISFHRLGIGRKLRKPNKEHLPNRSGTTSIQAE